MTTTSKPVRPWTAEEDRLIRELYPNTHNRVIAERLDRSYYSVKCRGTYLGLKKAESYLEAEKPGQFKSGQTPWNQGAHFNAGGRSVQTRFAKGHKPHNHKPVGSLRITEDGIVQKKVSDTGYTPKDWRALHAILWEEANGQPIPEGHLVRFRDGDNRNFETDNLVLVSRAENVVLNKMYKTDGLPEGGFEVMLNLARIKIIEK